MLRRLARRLARRFDEWRPVRYDRKPSTLPGTSFRIPKVRQVAAVTMVYRSPIILRKWVSHYGSLLGRRNLFIISHGECDEHRDVVEDCNYIVVPREFHYHINGMKASLLSAHSNALLTIYEAVICGDADELIVLDPQVEGNLRDYVLELPQDSVVAPIGFNLMPTEDYYDTAERVSLDSAILRQENRAVFAWEFCKPSVVKRPILFSTGQHGLIGSDFSVDESLVLFHLKFLALNSRVRI